MRRAESIAVWIYPTKYSAACCFIFIGKNKKTQSQCGWWVSGIDQYALSGADPSSTKLCYRCKELILKPLEEDIKAVAEKLEQPESKTKSVKKPSPKKPQRVPKKKAKKKTKK